MVSHCSTPCVPQILHVRQDLRKPRPRGRVKQNAIWLRCAVYMGFIGVYIYIYKSSYMYSFLNVYTHICSKWWWVAPNWIRQGIVVDREQLRLLGPFFINIFTRCAKNDPTHKHIYKSCMHPPSEIVSPWHDFYRTCDLSQSLATAWRIRGDINLELGPDLAVCCCLTESFVME